MQKPCGRFNVYHRRGRRLRLRKDFMKKILTLFFLIACAPAFSETRFHFSDTVQALTGGGSYTAFELELKNSNHSGAGNTFYGFRIPDMKLDAEAIGTAFEIGQGWHYGIHMVTNLPILFGPVPGGTQIYYDGSILSVSDSMIIYGDLSLSDRALKDFNVLAIKEEDLSPGVCPVKDEVRKDIGGATKELCVCDDVWICMPYRPGPMD